MAAAIVLAIVAALGITIAVVGPAHDKKTAAPVPVPGTAAPSASTSSGCALPQGDQTVPQTAPADTHWELVGSMAAPSAPAQYGPAQTQDGVRVCFAHNPLGALYAAVNILATTTQPQLRLPLIRILGAASAGRDLALRQLAATPARNAQDTKIQIAGFSFLNYTQQNTSVDLATRVTTLTGTGYAHLSVQLTWQDDDWRITLPTSGDFLETVAALPDLTGYIPWSGA